MVDLRHCKYSQPSERSEAQTQDLGRLSGYSRGYVKGICCVIFGVCFCGVEVFVSSLKAIGWAAALHTSDGIPPFFAPRFCVAISTKRASCWVMFKSDSFHAVARLISGLVFPNFCVLDTLETPEPALCFDNRRGPRAFHLCVL